jgi:hypothetical protein
MRWHGGRWKNFAGEWIDRCSKRLHEHWQTAETEQLDGVAIDLWRDGR